MLGSIGSPGRDGQRWPTRFGHPGALAYKRPAEQALECAHIFNDPLLEIPKDLTDAHPVIGTAAIFFGGNVATWQRAVERIVRFKPSSAEARTAQVMRT